MRIAHFSMGRCNPDSANGVDKTIYFLSRTEADLGHAVAVFSITNKPPIPIRGVELTTFAPDRLPLRLPSGLLKSLLQWEPDIVHLHSVYTPANAILAYHLRARDIPYIVTPNGALSPHVLQRKLYLKLLYKYLVEQPYLNRAASIHAVSDRELTDIRKYGVRPPIVLAPNGFDFAALPHESDEGLLRRRFPELGGKRIFLFLGRLAPLQKGLDLLLRGFHAAREALGETALVLVGPDWRGERSRLEGMARDLGIAAHVVFAGPAYGQEKFDLLAGAAVFVHTSRWEGLPSAVLEAAASGKPCLVTPEADPSGLLLSGKGGIVVPPRAESIGAGLSMFARMTDLQLRNMGLNGRKMVEAEFNWETIARQLVKAYSMYIGKAHGYSEGLGVDC
jgi:glycosyltransferase involved in cell wall biosynthesis